MSMCKAIVAINGFTASCELDAPHPGVAHRAEYGGGAVAISTVDWISDGEARAAQRKTKTKENA